VVSAIAGIVPKCPVAHADFFDADFESLMKLILTDYYFALQNAW